MYTHYVWLFLYHFNTYLPFNVIIQVPVLAYLHFAPFIFGWKGRVCVTWRVDAVEAARLAGCILWIDQWFWSWFVGLDTLKSFGLNLGAFQESGSDRKITANALLRRAVSKPTFQCFTSSRIAVTFREDLWEGNGINFECWNSSCWHFPVKLKVGTG